MQGGKKMKLEHIGIVVKDSARSSQFYQEVVGATVRDSHGDQRIKFTLLDVGGQTLELLEDLGQEKQREAGAIDHIAFRVDNLEQSLLKVKEVGAPLLFPEPREVGNMKIMFFAGPDGERIEFIELV